MSDMGNLWRKWMRPDIAGILPPLFDIHFLHLLKKRKKEVVWSSVKLTLQKFHVVFRADWCLVRHQGGARIQLFKHSQLIGFCKHGLNVWFSVFVLKTSFKKLKFTYIQCLECYRVSEATEAYCVCVWHLHMSHTPPCQPFFVFLQTLIYFCQRRDYWKKYCKYFADIKPMIALFPLIKQQTFIASGSVSFDLIIKRE